jgi:hypothetical protein
MRRSSGILALFFFCKPVNFYQPITGAVGTYATPNRILLLAWVRTEDALPVTHNAHAKGVLVVYSPHPNRRYAWSARQQLA